MKAPGTPTRRILPEVGKTTEFSGDDSQRLLGAGGRGEPAAIAIFILFTFPWVCCCW